MKMSPLMDLILEIKWTTHIAGNVPGGLGCHYRDGVASQVIAFLLCLFIGEFIQTLNLGQKKNQLDVDTHFKKLMGELK